MVQGYYNLDEAARILGMDPEKLSHMAQRREIRAFADRGTWRFRTQDVEEMARRLGLGSSPELQLGEAKAVKGPTTPPPQPKDESSVFDFSLTPTEEKQGSSELDIVIESPSSAKLKSTSKPTTPKPGPDSDVHLVFDVTDQIPPAHDSDVKLENSPTPSKAPPARKPDSAVQPGGRKKPASGAHHDSGVRLVPLEDDSTPTVPRPTAPDSDIRLEPGDRPRSEAASQRVPSPESLVPTEEINLDEEFQKEEAAAQGKMPKSKVKPKTNPKGGTVAGHVGTGPAPKAAPSGPKTPKPSQPTAEDEVSLGDLDVPGELTGAGGLSGINLHAPADSGINLAKPGASDDSLEFELSLDQETTPPPAEAGEKKDSSGEFELTLDESGSLAPLEEEGPVDSGDKDIFETDIDMPALDEESGSEAVALDEGDTDLESSDFDLSMGEEGSGSQVVALDEEEADEGAATVARRGRAAHLQEDETGDLDELLADDVVDEMEEDEAAPRRAPATVAAAPANWGVLPVIGLAPCVLFMAVVGIMSFELLHSMWGYHQPYKPTAFVTRAIAELFAGKVPD
jgi:hypothetical protein